ncbi:hypothetical protein LUZ60_002640 [Juncus effusus]|nr:hypothetical protein LUZ60_002640 [Juncus effusus]
MLHFRRRLTSSATTTSIDGDAVLRTLSLYSEDWRRALEFFHWAAAPPVNFAHTPLTLSRTVDILGKHLEFPQSISLISSFAGLNSPQFLLPSFRSLFNRLAAAHLVSELVDSFSIASKLGLGDQTTFHLLIDALCDKGHVSDAEKLSKSPPFSTLFIPETKTYNLLLGGWGKVRAWSRCKDFWHEMDRSGVEKDLHSYAIYMNALTKAGKPWQAIKLFKELNQKKIKPDIVIYNTAIHAIGRSQGIEFSIRLYREMVESGIKPNSATLNTIVKHFCIEGRFKEAYCFIGLMRRKHQCEPDVLTYHCFFQYLTRPQEIFKLFEQMEVSSWQPRMDTYVMLIKKFGRWGFLRPVFDIWRKMEERGLSPDAFAYGALIDALKEKGMIDLARKYDQEMLSKGLSAKPRKDLGTGLEDCIDDERINV